MATPHGGFRYEVMISYKHVDSKDFAKKLEAYLKQRNKRVFRDENEIKAGQHITKECERAIRESQVFVPIFSQHYCEGASEDEFFYNRDKARRPMVPIVLEGAVIPRNYRIGETSQVRIKEDFKENRGRYFKRILDGVNAHLSGPSHSGASTSPSDSLLCECGQNAKELTVKKRGPNKGRKFFGCPKPRGSQCDFFKWADDIVTSNPQTRAASTSSSVHCDCGLSAVELTVKKDGPSKGRKFWKCPKKRRSQCDFFEWADDLQASNSQSSGGLGQNGLEENRKRKRASTCGRCGEEGHTKRSKRCPLAQQTDN